MRKSLVGAVGTGDAQMPSLCRTHAACASGGGGGGEEDEQHEAAVEEKVQWARSTSVCRRAMPQRAVDGSGEGSDCACCAVCSVLCVCCVGVGGVWRSSTRFRAGGVRCEWAGGGECVGGVLRRFYFFGRGSAEGGGSGAWTWRRGSGGRKVEWVEIEMSAF